MREARERIMQEEGYILYTVLDGGVGRERRVVLAVPSPRHQLHGACETGERKYCIENIECSNECELREKHGWEFYIFFERKRAMKLLQLTINP